MNMSWLTQRDCRTVPSKTDALAVPTTQLTNTYIHTILEVKVGNEVAKLFSEHSTIFLIQCSAWEEIMMEASANRRNLKVPRMLALYLPAQFILDWIHYY